MTDLLPYLAMLPLTLIVLGFLLRVFWKASIDLLEDYGWPEVFVFVGAVFIIVTLFIAGLLQVI